MTTIGKYELFESLGKGGFGIVYRALDRTLEREVAVKVLHPQLAVDAEFLGRIRREAKLIASLDHPNIVGIYELGEEQGRIYIVMKYLPGGSLAKRLEEKGALAFGEALKVMEDICMGVQAVHAQGLVHRDLKPANILFDAQGRAVVSDFGLARAAQMSGSGLSSMLGGAGTPPYMPPEVWEEKRAGAAADVYALACVMFEMLTGKVLFAGESAPGIMTRHVNEGPRFPGEWPQGVPAGVEAVLRRALAKEPGERYASAGEFARALRGCAEQAAEREKEIAGLREAVETAIRLGEWEEAGRLLGEWAQLAPKDAVAGVYRKKVERELGAEEQRQSKAAEEKKRLEAEEKKKREAEEKKRQEEEEKRRREAEEKKKREAEERKRQEEAERASSPQRIQLAEGVYMEMVRVPAGEFLMGDEKRKVYLDEYWIGASPVTNEQYSAFVRAGRGKAPAHWSGGKIPRGKEKHPVVNVSWEDAVNFCGWVSMTTGQEVRLPTEAQWEKAARGTDGRTYPWGEREPNSSLANYGMNVKDTTPVGQYSPAGDSPYGCADMAGNVWEWCKDWYDGDYYKKAANRNPQGPSSGTYRVLRGGSWISYDYDLRVAYRFIRYNPAFHYGGIGFRCAVSPGK